MVKTSYFLLAVLVGALVTFALRALPFVLFRGSRSMPGWLQRLGEALPPAIMAVLVVYCLKGARTDPLGVGLPGLIAVLVTGLSYKWKHNTFLSIIVGTAVYMVLIRTLPLL